MSSIAGRPFADTHLAKFLAKRILELRPRKSQRQVASEAGFQAVNMLSMLKSGATRLPLDRVSALAKALECDPARLLVLALDQQDPAVAVVVKNIIGLAVSANEVVWIEALRDASDHSDPTLTARLRRALRMLFGK